MNAPWGWIGFDLDGTLAHHQSGSGIDRIGDPIGPMIDRLRAYLARGYEVRIMTARVSHPDQRLNQQQALSIQAWCERHGLPRLRVTCTKDYQMVRLYDDRAVGVVANTGQIIELTENTNA